jgi:uncharacterized membrane protein
MGYEPSTAVPDAPLARQRDETVDVLRGIAIVTMIAANMAPAVLAPPHPLWFRLYGSFAAPLFLLLAGMMVSLAARNKQRGWSYFLVRGCVIVTLGVAVDVLIEGIRPFTSMDVLYTIGIALPLAYGTRHVPAWLRWAGVLAIFAATPILQSVLGYTDYPTEYQLNGALVRIAVRPTSVLNHWLVDGWFPLFPWLGFALAGVNLGEIRWSREPPVRFNATAAVLLLAAGAGLWWYDPGGLEEREGYSELFYNSTLGYIATAWGIMLVLFSLVDRLPSLALGRPLQVLGSAALLSYLLHRAIVSYVLLPWWQQEAPTAMFLPVYVGLLAVVFGAAYLVRLAKRLGKKLLA